jgi:uncharacterized protein (TIGR02453 family)
VVDKFSGFPAEALAFYEGLEADNSKPYWQANKPVYDRAVRLPLQLLLAELEPVTGPFHTFRPNKDVRFSKDKTPYKTNTGSVAEGDGGTMYYVEFSAKGLRVGVGYYAMAADQLERFRAAIDDEHRGTEVDALCRALVGRGYTIGAISELKTAPRGYPKDHPRIELLRRKGLIAMRHWDPAPWLATAAVTKRVRGAFADGAALSAWLDTHVGPSLLPPDEAHRW